jgi:hypothetical protein
VGVPAPLKGAGPASIVGTTLAASGVVAPILAAWLFWREGGWDTYRTPLFWPFLFAAGLMVRFSASSMTDDPRLWRRFVARAAAVATAVSAGAALVAARNPITGLRGLDIVALAVLAGALVAAAGLASGLGERVSQGTWLKTAWCLAVCLLTMALIPRLLLLLR